MAFNVGERVRYRYQGPNDDPSQFMGEVTEIVFSYRVIFDDGTEELVEADDLEADE